MPCTNVCTVGSKCSKTDKEPSPQPPEGRAQRRKEKADPSTDLSLLFSSSNQPAAPASAPPRTLGGASKPRRKNSAKAGAVTGFLAQPWLGRDGGVTGETAGLPR